MIEFLNVSRWYGEVIGVNDVTCSISPGVTALLGMNGAGKTTMMRLITGQLRAQTGKIRVLGMEPFANADVYKKVGYCPSIDNFYEHQTGREFVYMLARMSGYFHTEAATRTDEMIERVGMRDRANRRIAGYSKGMRQRIKLAQAMLHEPDIILLDEPLNGLDPIGRREFINLLSALAAQGKAIVVSSHILFEVEQMTRSILLLHRGRLLATGDLRMIRELIDKHPHRIRIQTPTPREFAQKLVLLPNVISAKFEPGGKAVEIETKSPDQFYDQVMALVTEEGMALDGLASPDNNLESVFRYLVGE